MSGRRGFLAALVGFAVAPLAAKLLPESPAFHKDAFSMVASPLVDQDTGLAIRPASWGYDVLYGCKTVKPEYALRVLGDEEAE